MVVEWTLNVEGFGKIEEARIRISPFMIFAGDNNSGKSYIMTLLWGIMTIDLQDLFVENITKTAIFKQCAEWLASQQNDEEIELDKKTISMFFSLFNTSLDIHKEKLVRDLFNADLPVKSLKLSEEVPNLQLFLKLTEHVSHFSTQIENTQKYLIQIPSTAEIHLTAKVFFLCHRIVLGDLCSIGEGVVYLPASRTGFMLTYKALASKAVRLGFHSRRNEDLSSMGRLTEPVSHFLSDLISLNFAKNSRYFSVAEFLEDHILQGKIEKDHSPVPNYIFKPNGSEYEMSLHVTSSLVAELSPVVAYLKSDEFINSMIIEEPEAHLHLEMQRYIARALIRLVNMGLPVWITTHSDTLVQQINNLIKLQKNPHRNELADQYGYEEIDFLEPEKVRVYQFNSVGTKSSVHAQPLTANGFAFPTFTESIRGLTKETINFMENDDDEEDD